jgi:predicted transposase YbfD/YdcC
MGEYENIEKNHGRIETRRIRTTGLPAAYLGWDAVRQVFEIERIREKGMHVTKEVVYGITSLSQNVASAEKLLFYARRHWAIENELHNVRDVAFDEDRCRVRNRRKAQILAAFRNAAVTLLRHAGFTNITEGREWCAEERTRPIHLLVNRTE